MREKKAIARVMLVVCRDMWWRDGIMVEGERLSGMDEEEHQY